MMKTLYTVKMTNTGGRAGEVRNADGSLFVKVAQPGSDVAEATNPEQLFAAGYSACFNGALSVLLLQERIKAESTVSVTASLYEQGRFDFLIGVEIEGHIDGISLEETQKLLEKAHEVCPYSKATKGNVEVKIKAV